MKFKKARNLYFMILLVSIALYFMLRHSNPLFVYAIYFSLSISTIYFLYQLIAGAINIQRNFYFYSQNELPINSEKNICLSFDDGIHPINTVKVLDILKEHQIRAMFFIIGKNIAGNETILQRMIQEGHTIGNHSYHHSFWFDMKSSKTMRKEIELTNDKLVTLLGNLYKSKYFRPPYGVCNPALAKAILKSGMVSIGWNVRSMDTIMKSKDQLLQKLKLETKPGAIVLLHDRCEITIEALTDYIAFCKAQGYTFTTIT